MNYFRAFRLFNLTLLSFCFLITSSFGQSGSLNKELSRVSSPSYYNSQKIRELIKKGADPNTLNRYGNPVIGQAVSKNDEELIKFLLGQGANPNKKNTKGYSAMDFAKNKPKILKLLKQYKLFAALGNNKLNLTEANEMLRKAISFTSYNPEKIKKAVLNGADINLQDKKTGNNAILMAVIKNNLELATFLMRRGANSVHLNKRGYSAVRMAKMYKVNRSNTDKMLKVLAKDFPEGQGVLENIGPQKDGPSLDKYLSRFSFNKEKVRKEILKGAPINVQNKEGDTILHVAMKTENVPLSFIKFLLDKGIKLNIKNKKGRSALFIAMYSRLVNEKFLELLIKRGADVNEKLSGEETFFPSILEVLLKNEKP
ncbi:ankyrin repeat domain-containing protein [Bacteriovoracales bacterium]|nr:ankyrin repeat domain-containing protein [Bacteriovoracales bacterium]